MRKSGKKQKKQKALQGMALLLTAALLLGKSNLLMQAEEIREEAGTDTITVTDEEPENPDAGEGVDADTDTETVPGTSTDEETAGSDADAVSDVDTGDKENIIPQADETENASGEEAVSPAAVGTVFTVNKLTYVVLNENGENLEVGVGKYMEGEEISGALEIPSTVLYEGKEYKVVMIGNYAFENCSNLTSVTIPNSVTIISEHAFKGCSSLESVTIPASVTSILKHAFFGCSSLKSVTIPDSVTSIKEWAFSGCTSLESITIPANVTSIEEYTFFSCFKLENIIIPPGVTSIGKSAFSYCTSLESITIPASVTSIGYDGFGACSNLTSVTILNDKIDIGEYAFGNCRSLSSFQIAVSEDITRTPDVKIHHTSTGYNYDSFADCLTDRYLTFLTQDGTKELDATTTPMLAEAVSKYDEADGIEDDGMWYGWKLEKAPEIPDNPDPVYPVTIQVNKDGSEWSDSNKTFALSADNGATFITAPAEVSDDTYTIYENTGAADSASYVNTYVTVEIKGEGRQAEVDYYTVTFHDGDTILHEYDQVVLKDTKVSKPSLAPTKTGYNFEQWMTAKDGGIEFDFDNTPIIAKTDIYASWTAKTPDVVKQYTIKASAGDGGDINPNGDVKVDAGEKIRFFITPEDGYRVSSVLVDGMEELSSAQTAEYLRAGISDGQNNVKYYDFENVTRDHTLEVSFAAVQTGDDDDGSGGNGGGSGGSGGGTGYNSGSGDFSGGGTDVNSSTGGSDNNISAISSDLSVASDAGIVKTSGAAPASGSKEPKTGDAFHVEIYAALAMIAGLFYLLLYFADGIGGMTEEEKRELIARLVRWAKKGKPVRKYAALAAIFMVLVYYHAIGKHTLADDTQLLAVER